MTEFVKIGGNPTYKTMGDTWGDIGFRISVLMYLMVYPR